MTAHVLASSRVSRIAYLTDVEGRWDKLAGFAAGNPLVTLDADDRLRVADGAVLVFGGDAVDRGPAGRRVLRALLDAKAAQPGQVVLLAGNRDLNKLRLARELTGAPPAGAPDDATRGELLRWILARTMGAKDAFAHRRAELGAADDDAVVDSFLDDVAPDGLVTRYLAAARLGFRSGETLFVHGGVTVDNLGRVPGIAEVTADVDAWIERLNAFLAAAVDGFRAGRVTSTGAPSWDALLAYQAPLPGTRLHQASVVYARPTDERGDPVLPPPAVIATLRASGVRRVVVGHTPSGDCPAVLRDDGGFELVLADNSYGRVEAGSQLAIDGARLAVRGATVLDGGARAEVAWTLDPDDASALGLREPATRRLVKARLARGDYLTFRVVSGYEVEQRAVPPDALDRAALAPPR